MLTENQKDSRTVKGYEIYNSGLVEKLDGDKWLVKGKYLVEDIFNTLMCNCPDFTYRTDKRCKHIIAVEFDILNGEK